MRLKILMVCWDLSANSLVRTYPFAKFLSKEHDVKVIGYCSKDIFSYYKDDKDIKYIPIKNKKKVIPEVIKHARDSDIIHCFKFVPGSFMPSVIAKLLTRKKLVLDIEDYESAWNKSLWMKFWEKMTFIADRKIVSTSFLKNKFGGTYIPTGINTELFNSTKYNPNGFRKKNNIKPDETVVMFTGTFKFYKGCGELIAACEELVSEGEKIKCIFVGNIEERHKDVVSSIYPQLKSVVFMKSVMFDELPKVISGADIIAVPQTQGVGEQAQIPAKIFDAMAMAKPIIATKVGDIPNVVADAGIIVDDFTHENKSEWVKKETLSRKGIDGIKEAIKKLAYSQKLRKELGKKARIRCVENYSWEIMKNKTLEIYNSLF
ncbi:MAG: glycosyltransferase family 4 protein [Candidatus Nanoarchaeia archaeon]|nr:glycosyltransferase family 4 protein [Candidatus Nanoarchaeia archaeon]